MDTENDPSERVTPDHKTVMMMYGLFGTGLVLSLVPNAIAAVIVVLLLTGVLIGAYVIRGEAEPGSLKENHMTFIIRTIWIGTLFALLTTTIGTAYMMKATDYQILVNCILNDIGFNPYEYMGADMQVIFQKSMALSQAIADQCVPGFIEVNMRVFFNGVLITAAPVLLYFLVRFARGFSRAQGGYRVQKPEAWF